MSSTCPHVHVGGIAHVEVLLSDSTYIHIPYFLEISPHLELSPPSKSRRVVLTLNALNAALEFSPHVVKDRHYYCVYKRNVCARILTLILNNAQSARRILESPPSKSGRPRNVAAPN